ncbi:MAG: nickel pincer cofactor biosynthesis protein LarB [Thermoleophilia bacterium]
MSAAPGGSDGLDLQLILERVATGDLRVAEALRLLPLLQVARLEEFARLDLGRHSRKGVPEVIYAAGKTDEALRAIVLTFLREHGLALASRVAPERVEALSAACVESAAPAGITVQYDSAARLFEVWDARYQAPEGRGCIGILTAGTSDVGVAEEAATVARHMGCRVLRGYDVGVAGVHRLLEPLMEMVEAGADAFVVVAGMEGALPSLVAGLVGVPVIGVPKSGGYGVAGDGTAALYSMLQSCSPGLVVVNVDNGVGAGAAAALIARGAAEPGA